MLFRLTLFLALAECFLHICSGVNLGRYLRHYDTLNYDTTTLHRKHERARRSLSGKNVDFSFQAHGKYFELQLTRGAPHISKRFTLETGDEESKFIPDYLYVGKLADDPSSHIHGSIINGRFAGTIYTDGQEEYHVEDSKHHFDEKPEFHSIIYKSSDVDFDHHNDGGCGATEEIRGRMAAFQKTAINSADSINWSQKDHTQGENKYSNPNHQKNNRARRQTTEDSSCHMFLQADHTYTDHFGGDENAVTEVIASFNNHVSHVSIIYSQQRFGVWQDLDFVIERIKVNTTKDTTSGKNNPFSEPFIGVEKFLELNSLQNHDGYCLSYVFANRDFNDGVLGLAWVGSKDDRTSGGVCEQHKTFAGGVSQSLNTGIVTIQNYGSTVPSKVSYITFAHEIGHNYGSPHDYPSICKPGERKSSVGNYIMYPSATSGDKPNNNQFSPCSVENMTLVLTAKANCFVSSDRAVCGNRIIDEGEECDCGYEDQCTDDVCCNPRPNNSSRLPTSCQLKLTDGIKAECSPSVGPCCDVKTCFYVEESANEQCRAETECSEATYCQGMNATCPDPMAKNDSLPCNGHKQVCLNGTCSGSVCLIFEYEECFCDPPAKDEEVDESCHLCCLYNGVCTSSTNIPEMSNYTKQYGEVPVHSSSNERLLFQQPGSPCKDYLGYCDVFYKCRLVDSNGPLSRLTKAIFNPELYDNVFSWIQEYWWATILIILGVIIGMALFIKCFSVHTPSSNPNLKQARKVSHYTNTLRRRPRQPAGNNMQMR